MTIAGLERWPDWYSDAPPVGFLLREAYPERWLRIYSLPDGRRYPASGFDYAELLQRHNSVAADVIGLGDPCAILLLHPCKGRGTRAVGRAARLTTSGLPRLASLPVELSEEQTGVFGVPMCIFGPHTTWNDHAFDRFLTEVAEDRTHGLVVSLDSGRVYAPYDGGADLFYLTELERDHARERFRAWISPRDDGL
jgi:hypothetical protein